MDLQKITIKALTIARITIDMAVIRIGRNFKRWMRSLMIRLTYYNPTGWRITRKVRMAKVPKEAQAVKI